MGLAFLYLLVWLVLNWVGCRGQFMFLDNIVRNRAAIVAPWQRYAWQGNVWFLVHVGLIALSMGLLVVAAGVFFALDWPWISAERIPSGAELTVLGIFVAALVMVWIVYAAAMFLIHSFVIPLYFRQTMSLGAAFGTVGRLVVSRFLSIFVYVLVSFGLQLAGGILALLILVIACCLICWLTCIPCIGTMAFSFVLCQLILPISIFLRCFQLDCLAQFGPECDVWTVDVAAVSPRNHPDKLDAIAVLERARGPFLARQGFMVELDEQAARVEAAALRELTEGRCGADLPRVTVDKNAQASLDRFRHTLN